MKGIAKPKGNLHCLFLALLLLIVSVATAFAQGSTDPEQAAKRALLMLHNREVPEATLPCTEDEAKWWQDLRTAGEAVKHTLAGKKETKKFLELLAQGEGKSYQPPIPNRGPTVLFQSPFRSTDEALKRNISGTIALVLELRPNGTIGDVKVVQGLGYGLDENAARAARKIIFLPAVKDRQFVSTYMPMTMSVASIQTYP